MELEALPHTNEIQNLKYSLFLKRRFLPIFLATFLGAFNDNLLRSGLVVLIAYSASKGIVLPAPPEILVTICSALLMIPLILFAHISGPLADKFEKSRLVRYTKIAEMFIMACAFYGFAHQDIILLMAVLFISGTHSTFYVPIKFSILPDHLRAKELLAGNGFMAGGTYLAMLTGLIAGGLLVEYPGNVIGYVALSIATVGLIASYFILPSQIAHPEMELNFNVFHGIKSIVSYACKDKVIMHSIFALSWFMLVSSVFMAQFANCAQAVVHANNEVYILFLIVFSIGIAIGSLLCDTLLKGEITLRLTWLSTLGVSIFTYLMSVSTPVNPSDGPLLTMMQFLAVPTHWLVLGSMLMVAVCGGIYIVPLYAILQSNTPAQVRSRIIAASNMSDAVFMTLAAVVSAILLSLHFSILDLFTIIAVLNLGVVFYARRVFS